jgi:SAM-dependent methyltransferase
VSKEDRRRWEEKWTERDYMPEVSDLLQGHEDLLGTGVALDLACGRGQNSIWLAQHGYQTIGVDISWVALLGGQAEARRKGVARKTLFVQADLDGWRPPPQVFDLVAVFRFLDRGLLAPLKASLRPAGLLFYETRHVGILERLPDSTRGYLLQRGELPLLFEGWERMHYAESQENARIVVRKPLQ